MGIAMFYQLSRSTAEETLFALLGRAAGQGWRLMIRHPDPAWLAALDERLWQEPEEGFVGHGLEGTGHDADQPVLLGQGRASNGAQGIFLVGGAAPLPEDLSCERIWILFDQADAAAVREARLWWTSLTGQGMAAQYWSESDGKWEKKAEKAAG